MISIEDVFLAYYSCRKNKRGTQNAIEFEVNCEDNCIQLWKDINDRIYKPSKSIAFIVTKPRRREIFAASFRDRIVHHLIDMKIRPLLEIEFIEKTCNNRIGKGTSKCVEYLKKDILTVSNNYKEDCWVAKMDMKGFFMSIRKDLLTQQILLYISNNYNEEDKEDIKWLTEVTINDHPEKNCVLKSAWSEWALLEKNKSLFYVGDICGLPIGNLISQLLANFYLNEFDHYVSETLGFTHYGRYVDDFYIVHSDKNRILDSIPLMRTKLEEIGIELHPDKFYIQYFTRGIEFVGAVVKPARSYVHNRTVNNAFCKIREFNRIKDVENNADRFISSINSYLGFMKCNCSFAIRRNLLNELDRKWWDIISVDSDFGRVALRKKYNKNSSVKKEIIEIQLQNKRKRNGKAKRN